MFKATNLHKPRHLTKLLFVMSVTFRRSDLMLRQLCQHWPGSWQEGDTDQLL